jgi:hypothetical protein
VTIARRSAGPIIGIDVGEDFLDLAIVDGAGMRLRLARVAVKDVEGVGGTATDFAAIGELRRRLIAAAPELDELGAVTFIDSPRWPRDFDVAAAGVNGACVATASAGYSSSRAIDASLRAMVRRLALRKVDGAPFQLSLFPTPRFAFFAACVKDPRCKPHLAAIGRELFGAAIADADHAVAPTGGRIFTRFMLTGFAAYRAIEGIGAESYEAYPDLAFRLWADGIQIPPKSAGRAAFEARAEINRRLADVMGCAGAEGISTLDEADAAVLALSAAQARRSGLMAVIEHRGEGRFALALNADQARRAKLMPPGSR